MLIPDAREVQRPSPGGGSGVASKSRKIFAAAARLAGVRVIDPVRAMHEHVCSGGDPLYFEYDGHWNAAGHEFVGRWLEEELTRVVQ